MSSKPPLDKKYPVFQLKKLKAIQGQFMYEVTDLYLLKLYKKTLIVMNITNTGHQIDSFLPTTSYEQHMFSNQQTFGVNKRGN